MADIKNNYVSSFSTAVAGGVDTKYMRLIQAGSGMAVGQTGGTLVVTSGTTANKETIIRTKDTFNKDLRADIILKRSQAIANNRMYVGFSDIIGTGLAISVASASSATVTIPSTNDYYKTFKRLIKASSTGMVGMTFMLGAMNNVTGAIPGAYVVASTALSDTGIDVTFTVSGFTGSQTGNCMLYGWNYILAYIDGTGSTAVLFNTCRNGYPHPLGYTSLTSGTQTTNDMYTFTKNVDQVGFSRNLVSSMVTPTFLATRNDSLPDREGEMFFIIVVRNGTTNPASTTTYTVSELRIREIDANPVSISAVHMSGGEIGLKGVPVLATQAAKDRTVTSISAGTNLIGDVSVQPRAVTGGFASVNRLLSAAGSTNATSVKASAGRVYKIRGYSARASVCYMKLYNKASAPTVGTDTPVLTIPIKASDIIDIDFGSIGYYFSTGIAFAFTTGATDADTNALTAADIVGLNVIYA